MKANEILKKMYESHAWNDMGLYENDFDVVLEEVEDVEGESTDLWEMRIPEGRDTKPVLYWPSGRPTSFAGCAGYGTLDFYNISNREGILLPNWIVAEL